MATKLLKPVRRELIGLKDYRGRTVNVTIEPGDIIEFKTKGTRQRVECSLHSVYQLAKLLTFERLYQDKLKEYEQKKKAGYRVKKPKRPKMPVDKVILKAANS